MSTHDFKVRQAKDNVPSGKLIGLTIASMFVGGVCVLASSFVQSCETKDQRHGLVSYPAPKPPGTVEHSLIETSSRGLDQIAVQRQVLDHYGWVDRARGIARLPIDRAMDLMVEDARGQRLERRP